MTEEFLAEHNSELYLKLKKRWTKYYDKEIYQEVNFYLVYDFSGAVMCKSEIPHDFLLKIFYIFNMLNEIWNL